VHVGNEPEAAMTAVIDAVDAPPGAILLARVHVSTHSTQDLIFEDFLVSRVRII
jgi:hypothetical protein